jgi:hypothetical protein
MAVHCSCAPDDVQIAPETCRANVVKIEIKNIVYIVGLELNIYRVSWYEHYDHTRNLYCIYPNAR